MAFDQSTRNRLQRFVSDARTALTIEFTRQLQNEYGLDPISGHVTTQESLVHMNDSQRETARILRDTLSHYLATSPSGGVREALERIVREQAFTILNRLAALRMAEARGLLIESVGGGYNSKGFQLYARLAGSGLGETGDAYRCYLFSLFDEFALDLNVLFDRFSPYGRLFPRETTLLEILQLINNPDIAPLWAEDETIGWIYQYFNSKEERKKMRDESAAPRNSRELAVRNQFFTPRYVVEFLTDNTLGRIWYEMTQGNTALKDSCRYLVRRPNEIFLKPGEQTPVTAGGEPENLSQEELLKQPVHISHRPLKDPREIWMLDPACGSMHFGLYAFDLFETIYTEAWDLEATCELAREGANLKPLRESYSGDWEAFLRDVPRLIIEYNIHGIDIDPRAVQIAGLSLWLRAQRLWQQQEIKPAERPDIRRSNIVCAEPMPGEEKFLEEFLESHFSKTPEVRLLGQLVRRAFEAMKLAGEAGSLLKIEEEIAEDIAEAKRKWLAGAKVVQGRLFAVEAFEPDQLKFDLEVSGITNETFWDQAEERIYGALKQYAEQAEGGSYQRRMFAEDAVRGFAFIDICRKGYDVVLMNPPFGECAGRAFDYVDSRYTSWNDNVLCAFVKRGWELCSSAGSSGIIFDRTAIVKSTYGDFRRCSLVGDDRLFAVADLGWEVLDADVEVTSTVLHRSNSWGEGVFADLRAFEANEKADILRKCLLELSAGRSHGSLVVRQGTEFGKLPNSVLGYDFPDFLQQAFATSPSLEAAGFKAYQGHALKSEKHFRVWWELGRSSKNGFVARLFNGAGFAPYQTSLLDCVIAPIALEHLPKDTATVLRNSRQHLRPGVGFGKRGEFLCANVLPRDHVFTMEGQFIPVAEPDMAIELLCFLNTPLVRFALNKYCGQHKTSGYVNLLPYRRTPELLRTRKLVLHAIAEISKAKRLDELQPCFCPRQLQVSVRDFAHQLQSAVTDALSAIHQCEEQSHNELLKAFAVSFEERAHIETFRANQPRPKIPIEDADYDEGCSWLAAHTIYSLGIGIAFGRWDIRYATGEQVAPDLPDLFASLPICSPGQLQNAQGLPARPEDVPAAYPVRVPWDGILVDAPNHSLDIERRVRDVIEIIWTGSAGGPAAEAIEHEVCEILGVKSLRDYFRKPTCFFADHLKRYSKSRRQAPIYWPLSTASGNYTLWIYYHRLTDQTLYTCVNDFVEPKLRDIVATVNSLRAKGGGRSRAEEQELEKLEPFALELQTFRDELLRLAQMPWRPNLNDGVQITAAPLWKLFRLPKWQKTLKETWEKLEKGDYDWAHLAYTLWPDRVRAKCKTDKSLAIAHGLESLYQEPPVSGKKKRGRQAVTEAMDMGEE